MLKLGDGHIETQLLFSLLYEYFQIFPVKDFKKDSKDRKKKQSHLQGNSHKVSADFPEETLKTKREQHDIFKVLRGKNL